jgi:hypothetical protein
VEGLLLMLHWGMVATVVVVGKLLVMIDVAFLMKAGRYNV